MKKFQPSKSLLTVHLIKHMEDYVILLSIMMFGVFGLLAMKQFQGKGKPKTREKSAQEGLIKTYETNIDRLSIELRKQTGRASRLQALRDGEKALLAEETPEIASNQVTWEEIQALVKTQAPKYITFLPLMKDQIMDAVEGKSMEEVLQYVKQFKGSQQSKEATGQNVVEGWNPQWA